LELEAGSGRDHCLNLVYEQHGWVARRRRSNRNSGRVAGVARDTHPNNCPCGGTPPSRKSQTPQFRGHDALDTALGAGDELLYEIRYRPSSIERSERRLNSARDVAQRRTQAFEPLTLLGRKLQ
jgi:hypothetical protein